MSGFASRALWKAWYSSCLESTLDDAALALAGSALERVVLALIVGALEGVEVTVLREPEDVLVLA